MVDEKKFEPSSHLIKLKGKEYLEVKWRIAWFRDEHPDWSIYTEVLSNDLKERIAVVKATIYNDVGKIIGMAHKMETASDFADYVEKAETGAIGRALALCGYGTQFAPELEEGDRIVDAPVQKSQTVNTESKSNTCSGCGKDVNDRVSSFSNSKYGKTLCMDCQKGEQ